MVYGKFVRRNALLSAIRTWVFICCLAVPMSAAAAVETPNFTRTGVGIMALAVFVLAMGFVIAEEFTDLRKSKPVALAAGILWVLVAIAWQGRGLEGTREALEHNMLEYGELLLFLLA